MGALACWSYLHFQLDCVVRSVAWDRRVEGKAKNLDT